MTEHNEHDVMPEGQEKAPPGTRWMAILRWALVVGMAGLATAAVLHYAGSFDEEERASGQLYHCPMHPAVIQDHPGECPICHMDLVPIEAAAPPGGGGATHDGHEEHAVPGLVTVEISPERIQLIGMRTAQVTRGPLRGELRAAAAVAAREDARVSVQVRVAGWLEKLHVDTSGGKVTRGQALASVYSPDLLAAQKEYLSALEWSKKAGGGDVGMAAEARRRLEILNMPAAELAELEKTGVPVRTVIVRAPAAGTVTRRAALVEGGYVQPGTELYEISDLTRVWVLADVYEHDAGRLREGLAARLALPAYPGETFDGQVTFVYPAVDPSTRTLRARLEFKNPGLRLKPGMYGEVAIVLPSAEGLIVPREAVVDTGDVQYVFVALPGGRFQPRRVKVGARAGDSAHVLEGVAEGETVVTTANFLIDSESRLRAAIEGQGAGAMPPGHEGH